MATLLIPDLNEFHPGNMHGIQAMNGGAAVLRISDGLQHLDRTTPSRREQAAQLGYRWLGLYQFLRPDQDVLRQADMFCQVVGKLGSHEIPILDLELSLGGNEGVRALSWIDRVSTRLGRLPWLYSYVSFVNEHSLAGIFNGSRIHTWIAAYSTAEPSLGHTLWQCTDGVNGPHRTNWPGAGFCDTSVFHGTLDELAARTFPRQQHPAPPPPANGDKPVTQPAAPSPIRIDTGEPGRAVHLKAGEWVTVPFSRRWEDTAGQARPADRAPELRNELTGTPDHVRVLAGDVTLAFSVNGQATAGSGKVRYTEHAGGKLEDVIHRRIGFIGQDVQAAIHMVVGAKCSARLEIMVDNDMDVSAVFAGYTLRT